MFHLLPFGQWSRSPLNWNNSAAYHHIWLGQNSMDSPWNELFQVFWLECCTTNSWRRNLNEKYFDLLPRDWRVRTRITGPSDLQSRWSVYNPRYPCWWWSYEHDQRLASRVINQRTGFKWFSSDLDSFTKGYFLSISITRSIFIEFHWNTRQSIANWTLYEKSFSTNSTWPSVGPQFKFKEGRFSLMRKHKVYLIDMQITCLLLTE